MRSTGLRGLFLALFLMAAVTFSGTLQAAEFDIPDCRFNFGLRLAYGHHLTAPPVRLYTLLPRWGFFLVHPHTSPLPGKLFISLDFEGILSIAEAQDTGWEIGITPLLKFTLPVTKGLHAFLEGGVGIIGENFNSPAIPHAFIFASQVGAGVDIAIAPRWGLTLAYSFRHSSNAGIYKENPAFNVQFFQAGFIHYF
jgi:hypothetical protein